MLIKYLLLAARVWDGWDESKHRVSLTGSLVLVVELPNHRSGVRLRL